MLDFQAFPTLYLKSPPLSHTYTQAHTQSPACPSPDSSCFYQANDLSFGDHCVEEIQAPVLPLHGAVGIQRIAQPVIRGAPVRREGSIVCHSTQQQSSCQFWSQPNVHFLHNLFGLCGLASSTSQKHTQEGPQARPTGLEAFLSPCLELFGAQ